MFLRLCREGLVWVDINWMDNGECLDLIEKVCDVMKDCERIVNKVVR